MKKIYLSLLFAISFAGVYAQCPVQIQQTNVLCFGMCNGSAMAFGSGGGPYQYSWTPGGQTTQSITGLCAGTYTVVVVNASFCVATAVVTISQPTQVVATTTGQNPTSCTNCDGIIVGTASGGTPNYTYNWTPGNQTGTSMTGLCAGTYTFIVTDANGCTATSTWTLANPPGPSFGVTATPATGPNCNNGTATATVSGPGTYTYAWTPTGQTTSTATGLTGLAIYTVCVTNTGNGCSACQVVTVNCTTGIESHESNLGVNIYPNPATNNFTVEFTGEKTGEMSVEIYNIVGEEMFTQHLNVVKQLNKVIDVSTYPKGIYFVRIKGAEGTQTMKLIIN